MKDKERLNWLEEQGDGIALINDDQGFWAVASDGMQSLSEIPPDDLSTSYFIEKKYFKPSIREAIDYAILAEAEGLEIPEEGMI